MTGPLLNIIVAACLIGVPLAHFLTNCISPITLLGTAAGGALALASIAVSREETAPRGPAPTIELDRAIASDERRRVLVVGAGQLAQTLAEQLETAHDYCVVGFVDDDVAGEPSERWPVLGRREEAVAVAQRLDVDEVIVAYAPTWQQQLVEQLINEHPGIGVQVVPSPYESLLHNGRVRSVGDVALVQLLDRGKRPWDAAKRLVDVVLSATSLLVLAPLLLLVMAIIKLTSRGPAVFAQERIGRHQRPFTLYKLRTMVVNAEARTGPVLSAGLEDPRLTAIGKWMRRLRFDELPQLWNVVRGDMSLVGPRPERACFVERFQQMTPLYAARHSVRPGITGLAQVCGGYRTDARDKLRFDLIYVAHRSMGLDLTILMRTLAIVLSSKGS